MLKIIFSVLWERNKDIEYKYFAIKKRLFLFKEILKYSLGLLNLYDKGIVNFLHSVYLRMCIFKRES